MSKGRVMIYQLPQDIAEGNRSYKTKQSLQKKTGRKSLLPVLVIVIVLLPVKRVLEHREKLL
jgi:hypothetical protein